MCDAVALFHNTTLLNSSDPISIVWAAKPQLSTKIRLFQD